MGLRQEKLSLEIRDLLASCFSANTMSDPGLEGVSITHVKVSADLQIATVYFRIFNQENINAAKSALKRSKGFLRNHIARNTKLRRTPDLRFFYDESVEYGAHIESLLDLAKKKDDD